jgi:transposase
MVTLSGKNIQYDPKQTQAELLDLVRLRGPKFVRCELDAVSHDDGHIVVRLSPYHCQYNLIELVWALVKREVASENTAFRLSNVGNFNEQCRQKYYKKCLAKLYLSTLKILRTKISVANRHVVSPWIQ